MRLGPLALVENTDADPFPDRLTAVDWAYDNSGAGIAAGDTGTSSVPAPTSLTLLATGAVGVAAMRRRREARGGKSVADQGRAAA